MECHVFHKLILRCLDHLQRAAPELIIKSDSGCLPADNRDFLGFLWLISVNVLLRYRISTRHKFDIHCAIRLCLNRLIHTVAGDMETDIGYHAVLRCLLDMPYWAA